jgi:hypothetical protein
MCDAVVGPVTRTRMPSVFTDAAMAQCFSYMKRTGHMPHTPELMQMLLNVKMLKPGGHSLAQLRKRLRQYAHLHHLKLVYGAVTGHLRIPADVKPERASFSDKWDKKLNSNPEQIDKIAALDEVSKHAYPHPKSKPP